VVFYQECPDEETMGMVETMVFQKLKEYREQANRERFILPKEDKIYIFSDTIKECLEFLK
jgi:CHAD domain-containing protein